ncbi:quinoprotein dehydrogenase-associated SoxYZ-like carrier [Lutibaculum baratangense]|uniref:Sulfur oxidation protein SoxZ n=1 Tax=Lutibaculum baratangense AMV1 TaxID=631454 RepID=V4TIG5_9HYPH|nr:quinoprotein dehydrogenase-associated SoxYZ-like carrier [Lutibaculum baratangense]ESR25793.1 hypothetical protein N177_1128 [Lutibaculum baratangense AMV1]
MLERLRGMIVAGMAAILAASVPIPASGAEEDGGAWADIVENVFDGRPMLADGVVTLEAPYRAEDAAIVPMTIAAGLPPEDGRRVERLTLVIDENPAPVAATFELGETAGVTRIATRVRVNRYTNVHAVAELSDGSLHVAEAFVKASGGCSAPAAKDPQEALAHLGEMKLRQFGRMSEPGGEGPRAEVQLMIRHPNNSGLQMDQLTRHYIPAHFVREVSILQGGDLVMRMEGGISLAEDPNFRFDFVPTGEPLRVEVVDTEDNVFQGEWPLEIARDS